MDELMDALDETLHALGGRMEWARLDFRPGQSPEGAVAWFRADSPNRERPYVSHALYYRRDPRGAWVADLVQGHYDLLRGEAVDDALGRTI